MKKFILIIFSISLIYWNCESNGPVKSERVVIGVSSDIENINPLFAFGLLEGNIREILYLGLIKLDWNDEIGEPVPSPMLAKSWEWAFDSSSIIFNLRDDVYWSDSTKFTAEDVLFSFDLYSDPTVQSTFYGGYDMFFTESEGHIDLKKSIEILSSAKVKMNFRPGSKPNLFDVDMPILQKKMFSAISRKDLSTTNIADKMVTNGAYTLASWNKNESIILKAVPNSILYQPDMVKELVFKIVPDDNSRLTQLKNGEIDLIEDVNIEAIAALKKLDHIKIVARTGRDYDFIGWNNIDPKSFASKSAAIPNKFFGSPVVRRALTYAINREEILKEYLQGYGKLSFGPVSPIFKTYYNSEIIPYEYNPAKSKELLSLEGWVDKDNDGIVEKGNQTFSFKLHIASGNPRRDFAATVVKNNLKAVGIDANIESMEMGTFINKLFDHEFDAFMAGWTIPIPIDLKPYWYSNFEKGPLNLVGFKNSDVDEILDRIENVKSVEKKVELYKRIQELFHQFEPTTFMYWLDVKTAYNAKIKNIQINPLGAIQHCWEWRIEALD